MSSDSSPAPQVYLDNGATTWPKPPVVYETLDQTFRHMFSPKRGTAQAARSGADKLMGARETLARLFNIPDASRVCFTSGATHALNLAIQGLPWQPGDGAVISAVEHHALSRPVRKMVREKGIRLFVVPYSHDVPFDLAAYKQILQNEPNIRLVAATHASNVIGVVLPIAEIGALAHRHGALFLVDAAQTAGVMPVDVQAAHIDMLAVPGHKGLYGPPGVGALYVGEQVTLVPLMEGGTGDDSGKHEMSGKLPACLEVGTIALPNIMALAAGAQWVQESGLETIHRHEMALFDQLLAGMDALTPLTLYGHTRRAEKTPVLSFNLPGVAPKVLGQHLADEYGIALRAGFHCAPMAHEVLGTLAGGGTVRASLGYFTRPSDIEALLSALDQLVSRQDSLVSASASVSVGAP